MAAKKNLLRPRKLFAALIVAFFIIILDLLTKEILKEKNYIVIDGFLEINSTNNYGVLYGLFGNSIFFTMILPFLVLGGLIYFLIKAKISEVVPITMIISGLIGNLITRLHYGYVIDFIYVPFLQPVFPNFNIADLSAFIGVVLLAIILIKEK